MSSNDLVIVFDGICLLIFLINIYLGYKGGFFKTVINFISGIVAFFLSYNFAPVFAKVINMSFFLPEEYLLIAPFVNLVIWYAMIFFTVLIVLKIVAILTTVINKTPILGFMNKLLGAIVSFIYSFIIVALISIILSLPLFKFKEAYEASFFKPINTVAVTALNSVAGLNLEIDTHTDDYKEKLYNWLIENEMLNRHDDKNLFFDLINKGIYE